MASEQHNFIVSAIARKMKLDGFGIIYLDGKYQDVETLCDYNDETTPTNNLE